MKINLHMFLSKSHDYEMGYLWKTMRRMHYHLVAFSANIICHHLILLLFTNLVASGQNSEYISNPKRHNCNCYI